MNTQIFLDNISSDSVRVEPKLSGKEKEIFFYSEKVGFLGTRFPYYFDYNGFDMDSYIVIFTVSGTGTLNFRGVDYLLDAYSVAFIPCNEEYRFSASSNDRRWRFLYLNFNGKMAKEYYCYVMSGQKPVGTVENYTTVATLIWQIINRYKSGVFEPHSGFAVSINIQQILSEILRINAPVPYDIDAPLFIKDLFYFMDMRYTENITLDMMENHYSVSKYHIERQFKKYSGITIKEYIMIKRIERAKFLLKNTDKTVSDIAEEVGFYNSGHFINQFKKREFVTPNAYRRVVKKL